MEEKRKKTMTKQPNNNKLIYLYQFSQDNQDKKKGCLEN